MFLEVCVHFSVIVHVDMPPRYAHSDWVKVQCLMKPMGWIVEHIARICYNVGAIRLRKQRVFGYVWVEAVNRRHVGSNVKISRRLGWTNEPALAAHCHVAVAMSS